MYSHKSCEAKNLKPATTTTNKHNNLAFGNICSYSKYNVTFFFGMTTVNN